METSDQMQTDVQSSNRLSFPIQTHFSRLVQELEIALELFLGKSIPSTPARAVAAFGNLPVLHREQILRGLEGQLELLYEIMASGIDSCNEQALVHLAVNKLGLLVDNEFLDGILQTDIVEIYDSEQVQVYRSFSCFALCNYSIGELVTYPWYELYERPSWVQERILELSAPVFLGKRRMQSVEGLLPCYVLKETLTESREAFEVEEKFYARMVSGLSHQPYLLAVKKIRPLGPVSADNLTFL